MPTREITIPYVMSDRYEATGFIFVKNGCCPDSPIILTKRINPTTKNIWSCQCTCNMWVTGGHDNPYDAVLDYIEMTEDTERRIKARECNIDIDDMSDENTWNIPNYWSDED